MNMQQLRKSLLFSFLLLAVSLPGGASVAAKGPGGGGTSETAGNNLSFPVIWAEGVTKALPGTAGMTPVLNGKFWYQWGTNGVDPNVTPASCLPDPDENGIGWYCDDGVAGTVSPDHDVTTLTATTPLPPAKAYLQKDPLNIWQAGTAVAPQTTNPETGETIPYAVDWIDWGDSLESVDWYTRSQVRIEVVLFKDLDEPMLEYEMRHISGWGTDEVHGLATTLGGAITAPEGLGQQATIYSPCARLTIQKLLVAREAVPSLTWDPALGQWTGAGMINPPIFNKAVYEAGDGPGYYSAEINVKGRIIYGYTWNVRQLHDITDGTAAGDYRLTFSLDETCGTVQRNTAINDQTRIVVPLEEEVVTAALTVETASTDEGGGVAVIDSANNLTYIDVRILDRSGGGGGGGGRR